MENKLTVRDFLSEVEDKLAQESIDLHEAESDAFNYADMKLYEEIQECFNTLRIKKYFLNQLWDMLEEIESE